MENKKDPAGHGPEDPGGRFQCLKKNTGVAAVIIATVRHRWRAQSAKMDYATGAGAWGVRMTNKCKCGRSLKYNPISGAIIEVLPCVCGRTGYIQAGHSRPAKTRSFENEL